MNKIKALGYKLAVPLATGIGLAVAGFASAVYTPTEMDTAIGTFADGIVETLGYLFTENLPTVAGIAAAIIGLFLVWGLVRKSARMR